MEWATPEDDRVCWGVVVDDIHLSGFPIAMLSGEREVSEDGVGVRDDLNSRAGRAYLFAKKRMRTLHTIRRVGHTASQLRVTCA
jgi:hypothetical protein